MEKVKLENAEEYRDPSRYDQENDSFMDDIPFLLKWAKIQGGPIIDVACGTGRATMPLAQAGYEVIGIDINGGMLEEAKNKSGNLGLNIQWEEQDCTDFILDLKSQLVYTVGNSFQHFLTNEAQDKLLSSIHTHLEPGGIFIFGTRFPSAEELLQPGTEEYWRSYIDNDTNRKVEMYTINSYDTLEQLQHYTTIRKYIGADGTVVKESRTNVSLRYVFPKEMERILNSHGFEIEQVYRDWNETPISNDSDGMVYICRKV